jgi:hypothetical protein
MISERNETGKLSPPLHLRMAFYHSKGTGLIIIMLSQSSGESGEECVTNIFQKKFISMQ